jgi:hypothetical protein
MKTSRVASLIVTVAFIAAVIVGFSKAQAIEDWLRLRNYTPPASIVTLASEDTMTPLAKHIFYVTHPTLEANVQAFRQDCNNSEQTIVLGCYKSGVGSGSFLFVYQVQDPRLHGVQEVTAAHEMLHAAYDRLSTKDRNNIDAMLEDYYKNDVKDQRIIDTINAYKKTEPNDVVNEMHSIFGTEIPNLPTPLENYYKKYFTDRSQVTAYAANYEDEFTSRRDQISADDARLADMKAQIQSEEQDLSAQLASLQADRANIENSTSRSEVDAYNSRVSRYNSGVHQLQADIASYNALVEARNSIAAELASLQSSLDTRLTTQAAQ